MRRTKPMRRTVVSLFSQRSSSNMPIPMLLEADPSRRARLLQWGVSILVLILLGVGSAAAQLADAPWPKFGADLQNTGQSAFGDAGLSWQVASIGTARTGPSIARDGTIYVAGGSFGNAMLYALNPDGTQRWIFDPGGLNAGSVQPLVGPDGTVYVGGEDGNNNGLLYAVDPVTGVQDWQFFAEARPVRVAPAIAADGTIYVMAGSFSSGGAVYAVDPGTGNARWSVSLRDYSLASLTIADDGTVYAGTVDGALYAIDPATQTADSLTSVQGTVRGLALGTDGTLYVTSEGNQPQLVAVDPATGTQQWNAPATLFSITAPAIGPDGRIFVGVSGEVTGGLYAFSSNGTERWSISTDGLVDAAPAVAADGTVYVSVGSGTNSQLLALDPADGTQRWAFNPGAGLDHAPVIAADGTVYLASDDGLFSVIGPRVAAVPDPVAFGQVEARDTTAQQVAIENTGDANLRLTGLSITGTDAEAFAITAGGEPVTLAPGQQHTVTVAFSSDEGGTREAQLAIESNIGSTTVSLSATAVAVDLSPAQLPALVVGEPVDLSISVPQYFRPTTSTFYYRPAGTSAYERIPLTPTADSTLLTGTIPGSAVTLRGLDYYAEFSDGALTVTFPQANPSSDPAWVPAQFDQHTPPISLASNAYRMVSVPAALDDASLAAVFADYGAYEPARWRVVRWDPQSETYEDLPNLDDVPATPGRAYWLITRDGEPFTLRSGQSTDASAPYTISLQPGWNQIANPYAFPVSLTRLDVSESVIRIVYYDGQAFQDVSSSLAPWGGYFVYNSASGPVTLTVPPVAANAEVPVPGGTTAKASRDTSDFAMRLAAQLADGSLRDTRNIIGLAGGARVGYDARDDIEAPPIGDHVRLSIVADGKRWAGNFKPLRGDGQWWDVEVTASVDEPFLTRKRVQIRLDERGRRPEDFRRYVIDRDTGLPIEADDGVFTVTLDRAHPVRHLRVILGTPAFAKIHANEGARDPLTNALQPNYPNPFAQSTTIPYQIQSSRHVLVEIYNMLGRRVRTLVDATQKAGAYEVQWDGRNARGARVASGIYFCRLEAGSFKAVRKIILVR